MKYLCTIIFLPILLMQKGKEHRCKYIKSFGQVSNTWVLLSGGPRVLQMQSWERGLSNWRALWSWQRHEGFLWLRLLREPDDFYRKWDFKLGGLVQWGTPIWRWRLLQRWSWLSGERVSRLWFWGWPNQHYRDLLLHYRFVRISPFLSRLPTNLTFLQV